MYLLDTNVLSELRRPERADANVRTWAAVIHNTPRARLALSGAIEMPTVLPETGVQWGMLVHPRSGSNAMFMAVYRFTLKPGAEVQFRKDWAEVTRIARDEGRSLGSALGQASDGSWVAVARWPTKKMRDDWFANTSRTAEASAGMRLAIEHRFDDLEIEITDDLTI